jgi:hypothetical protein
MALIGAGRLAAAEMLLRAMSHGAAHGHGTQARLLAEIGVALGQSMLAAERAEHGRALDLLLPLRHRIRRIGGSHAQREIFHLGLIDAALQAGRRSAAQTLLRERLRLRPRDREAQRRLASLEPEPAPDFALRLLRSDDAPFAHPG